MANKRSSLRQHLNEPFDHKSLLDYLLVIVFSIPLLTLSILGLLYLLKIYNLVQ